MQLTMEKITPQLAAEYLKKNTNNYRKLSRMKVKSYAEDMKAGRWEKNGETIVFGEDGILKDGQHRLAAIVLSGVTVEMAVVRGVAKDVTIYDIGTNRTLANIVNANGLELPRRAVAAAKLIVSNFTHNYAKAEVVEYAGAHAAELARACRISESTKSGYSRKASCCLATYLALDIGMQSYMIEVFFRIFNSGNIVGAEGYEPSPALVARRMFESWKNRPVDQTVQKEQTEIILLALRDFCKKATRQKNYTISEPMQVDELIAKMAEKDQAKAG